MVKGETYNKQLFENEAFRHFMNVFLSGESGITKGCELTQTSLTIAISPGYFFILGGLLREKTGVTLELPSEAGYYKLVYEIDLSKTNTSESFEQGSYKFIKGVGSYPNLTQEDLDDNGTVYQFEFCKFRITDNGISDYQDTRAIFNTYDRIKIVELFEGNSANATLTDNFTNYDELLIETNYPSGQRQTWIVDNPVNNCNIRISTGNYDGWIYFATTMYELKEGNKIQENLSTSCVIQGPDGFSQKIGRTNKFKITKVLGIKKGV